MSKLKQFRNHRRKLAISTLAILIILTPLAIFISRNPKLTEAKWWSDGWSYRKPITFGNSGSADSDKYVVFDVDTASSITDGKMRSDCQDVRFTDSHGNPLEYMLGKPSSSDTPAFEEETEYSSGTNASSRSFSHTVSSGSDLALVVVYHGINSQAGQVPVDVDTVTFNGDSMTKHIEYDSESTNRNYVSSIWVLPNPDVGTYTVSLTFDSAVTEHVAYAATFSGVHQTTPVGSTATYGWTQEDARLDLTTQFDSSMIVGGNHIMHASSNRSYTMPYSPATESYEKDSSTPIDTNVVQSAGGYQPAPSAGDHQMYIDVDATVNNQGSNGAAIELRSANNTNSSGCNESDTEYAVLMPEIIAGDNLIYVYYGNPDASDGSTKLWGETEFSPTSGPSVNSESAGKTPLAYWSFDSHDGGRFFDLIRDNNLMIANDYISETQIVDSVNEDAFQQRYQGDQITRANDGDLYAGLVLATSDYEAGIAFSETSGRTWTALGTEYGDHDPDDGSRMAATLDSQGIVHTIFDDHVSVLDGPKYHTFDTNTGSWVGEPEHAFTYTKSDPADVHQNYHLDIAVDSNDAPHVVVTEDDQTGTDDDTLYYVNKTGGSWNSEVTLASVDNDHSSIHITVSDENVPEIAYWDNSGTDSVVALQGNQNDATSFSSYTVDSAVLTGGDPAYADITIDSDGNTWVAIVDSDTYVKLAKHDDGTSWTDSGNWTTGITNSNVGTHPSITAVGTDIYVFYIDDNDDVVYDIYDGSSWNGETTLHTGTYESIKVNDTSLNNHFGDVVLDYTFSNGGDDVRYGRLGVGNEPTWVSEDLCILGKCLQFDGSDDIAVTAERNELNFSDVAEDGVTFSFWVKALSDGENDTGEIFEKGSTYCRTDTEGSGQVDLECNLDLDGTDANLNITNALTLGTWHHVSVGYTDDADDEITIYIDGQDMGTSSGSSGSLTDVTDAIILGGDTSNNFHGFLDEFKIFPYERSSDEVKSDYVIGAAAGGSNAILGIDSNDPLNQGLVGYWKLDESGGDADDSSGFDYTLTNNGTTTYTTGQFGNGSEHVPASSQYLSTASTISDVKTFSAWVNPDATTNYIVSLTSSAYITASSGTLSATGFTDPTIYVDGVESSTLTADTWQLVTVTTDTAIDANQFYLGRQDTNYYDGTIDEARVYNRVLSPSEVTQLYEWAPGPIGYWPMDEGTGTNTVYDISGNNHNGTLNGTMTEEDWVPGKMGQGLNFDGSDDNIGISDTAKLSSLEGFTMSAWVRWISFATNSQPIISKGETAGNKEFRFRTIDTDTLNCHFSTTGSDENGGSSDISLLGQEWIHVACTWDGSNIRIYADGVLLGTHSATGDMYDAGEDLAIGAYTDGGYYLNGDIDEVKIYDYARTPGQVIEDMNAGHPVGGSPVGSAIGHWKFDDMSGDTAYDSGTGGNNGNLNGSCPGASTCPTWTTSGKINGALSYDGGDLTDLGDLSFTEGVNKLTWSFWIKPTTLSTADCIICKTNSVATQTGWFFNTASSDSDSFVVSIPTTTSDSSTWVAYDGLLADGVWDHITIVYDGTLAGNTNRIKLYENGILLPQTSDSGTIPSSTQSTTSNAVIGASSDSAIYFTGVVDELKMFTTALTQEQVNIVYNFGSSTSIATEQNERDDITDGDYMNTLVGYWPLDENTGTTDTYDKSTNSNDGTLNSITTSSWRTGKVGSALYFDGTADYVSISDPGTDSIFDKGSGDQITLSAWIKLATYPGDGNYYPIITKGETGATNANYQFGFMGSGSLTLLYFGFMQSGGSWIDWRTSDLTTDVPLDTWHHVTFTLEYGDLANSEAFYIDGIEYPVADPGADVTPTESNSDLWIGGVDWDGGGFDYGFDGDIDEVKIFDAVLTPAQAAYEHNRGKPVAWWQFDECSGTTLNDTSGNGNTGTITIGGTGDYTAPGTCDSGTGTDAWNAGTTGKFNSALGFDGTNDYAYITGGRGIDMDDNLDQEYSVTAWIYPHSSGDDNAGRIFSFAQNEECFLENQSGSKIDITCHRDLTTSNATLTITEAITTNTWQHITLVWTNDSDDEISIYIDGELKGTSTNGSGNTEPGFAGNMYIGDDALSGGAFDGLIDDVRVYNYALSETQIKGVINHGAILFE